jgi:protein subunit release factor A
MKLDNKDVHIRVIDQRIGMGIGGFVTVIRLYHIPTGILIEMPQVTRAQFYDRKLAMEMLEYALSEIEIDPEKETNNG